MDDLTNNWNNLTLSDKEKTEFTLSKDQRLGEFIIAAKFFTPRFLVMDGVARTFKQLWSSTNGFKIQHLGDHKVLFVFDNLADVDHILKNQPWSFGKHLIVIQRYDSDTPARELRFNKATFWVQVHDIPIRYMSQKVAESLCETVGEVIRSIGVADEEGGRFMRVRVTIDLNLPLCRGRLVSLANGDRVWVYFKYERLPNICYWCGRLDHDDKNCELWIQSKGTLSTDSRQFGAHLRAAPYTSVGKDVIYVPGFYESRHSSVRSAPVGRSEGLAKERLTETVSEQNPVEPKAANTDMDCEICGDAINSKSLPKKRTENGQEDIMGEVNANLFPFKSESTIQDNLKSPTFQDPHKAKDVFAETLIEIDKEISKFDLPNLDLEGKQHSTIPTVSTQPKLSLTTDPTHNPPKPDSRDSTYPPTTCLASHTTPTEPLSADYPISPIPQSGTWKRLPRPDQGQYSAVGLCSLKKHSGSAVESQDELPRKRRQVSLSNKYNNQSLAEAGSQLRQDQ